MKRQFRGAVGKAAPEIEAGKIDRGDAQGQSRRIGRIKAEEAADGERLPVISLEREGNDETADEEEEPDTKRAPVERSE
jgi:hypothetical protein